MDESDNLELLGGSRSADMTQSVLASWTFTIPGYIPVLVNAAVGHHWSKKHKLRKGATDILAFQSRESGVPRIDWRKPAIRRVQMGFFGWAKGRKIPDPDALMKYQLDALCAAWLIVDDSRNWCVWERPQMQRSDNPRAIITLEDIGYGPPFASEDRLPQMRRLTRGKNKSADQLIAELKEKYSGVPKRKPR